jgi:hypothetical protein
MKNYLESLFEGFTLSSVGGLLEHQEHRAGHPEVVVHGGKEEQLLVLRSGLNFLSGSFEIAFQQNV